MKVVVKRLFLLLPMFLLFAFSNVNGEVVKIEDYEYYQAGVFAQISASHYQAAGVTTDGRLFTWGNNEHGQLGNGSTDDSGIPIDITGNFGLNLNELIASVDVGEYQMLALTTENRVFVWGKGQTSLPVDITSSFGLGVGENVVVIEAAFDNYFVLTDAGRYFSWGVGNGGALGNGGTSIVSTPTDHTSHLPLIPGEFLVDLDSTSGSVLAITNLGTLIGWGRNGSGQLFIGNNTDQPTPLVLSGEFTFAPGETITAFGAGSAFSVVATSEGKVYTAGTNSWNQLGDGTAISRNTPTDISSNFGFDTGEYITALDSDSHTIALSSLDNVYGWGYNNANQIHSGGGNISLPVDITGNFPYDNEVASTIHVGFNSSYVLSTDNCLFVWGRNLSGQLGLGEIGSHLNTAVPVKHPKNFDILNVERVFLRSGFIDMSSDFDHTLLLTQENDLFVWGRNDYGQVGVGNLINQHTPTKITDSFGLAPSETIIEIATGYKHSVVLTSERRVFTWGQGWYGQLGTTLQDTETSPVDITGNIPLGIGDYVVSIFCGSYSTYLITNNGKLIAFGNNSHGEMGDGGTTAKLTPEDITSHWGFDVGAYPTDVIAGSYHTFVLTSNYKLYAVGDNDLGQLGDGTFVDKTSPVDITSSIPFNIGGVGIIDFQSGGSYSGLLSGDGDLYMWGSGSYGKLGEGGAVDRGSPFLINNQFGIDVDEDLIQLSVGQGHSMVLTSKGKIFSYGYGTDYALGTTYIVPEEYPVNVTSNLDVGSDTYGDLILGNKTSFVLTQEGNLYGLGSNGEGQLGIEIFGNQQYLKKVTKDEEQISVVRFIDMQEEQYIDNSHVYLNIYFNYDIYEYIDYVVVSGVTYTKTSMEEDVGKVTVKIPNTYVLSEVITFTLEGLSLGSGVLNPEGPDTVSATMFDDVVAPTFDPIADQVVVAGTSDIDWTTYIENIVDNSPGTFILREVDGVNYNLNGTYIVQVEVEDESGNIGTDTFNVDVIDTDPPVITYTGETTFEVGGPIYDFLAYATAVDPQDGDVTADITIVDPVDFGSTGDYTIEFDVYDSSMNLGELDVIISVVDTTPPTFDLPPTITIELGTSDIDWSSYMTNVDDNSGETVSTYEWVDNVNYFVPGTYTAEVVAEDLYGNQSQDSILVTVEDTTAPSCDPILDVTYEVNTQSNVDYSQYVTGVYDASLGSVVIDWVDVVDYGVVGTYGMSVTLTDASNNVHTEYFDVHIVDTTGPNITYIGNPVYEVGTVLSNLSDLFTITDNSGREVTIVEILDDFDFYQPGMYSIHVTATDDYGNTSTLSVSVEMIDTTAPTFDFIENQEFYLGDSYPVDWAQLVQNVVENSSSGYYIYYDESVNYYSPAYGYVMIYVEDSSGNIGSQYFEVVTIDATPPEIFVFGDVYTGLNEMPNYYDYFNAYDEVDGEVTYLAYWDDASVDYSVVGTYSVTIYARDYSYNQSMISITVHVVDIMPPSFDLIEDMIFELGEYDGYDWIGLVHNLSDDSGAVPVVVVYEDTVDFTMVGTYMVTVRATDPSGNNFDRSFNVTIEDTTPPVFIEELDNVEIGVNAIEITIADQADNVSDESLEVTFDFICPVEFGVVGHYICTVTATDASGNSTDTQFVVSVIDEEPPLFELIGEDMVTIELGDSYTEPGATCLEDDCMFMIIGDVNTDVVGTYMVYYHAYDQYDNMIVLNRAVTVVDTTPPVIELNPGIDTIFVKEEHIDTGVTVFDLQDVTIELTGSVDSNEPSKWTLTYTATDKSGNSSTAIRHVSVRESNANPEFDIGAFLSSLDVGDVLNPPMCMVTFDGAPVPCVIDTSGVDTSIAGEYTFTASADYRGNTYHREITVWVWDFEVGSAIDPVGYRKKEEEVIV